MKALALALCASLLAGCTTRELYDTAQANRHHACLKLPDLDERERCRRAAQLGYDDYQKQLEQARSR